MENLKFKSSIEKHEIERITVENHAPEIRFKNEKKEMCLSNRRDALIQEMKETRLMIMARKDKVLGEISKTIPHEMERAMVLIEGRKEVFQSENKKRVLRF